jgi:hypothetical protein
MIYNTHIGRFKRVYRIDLRYNRLGDMFYTTDIIHISIDHEFGIRHQKNWTPFEYCHGCIFENGLLSASYIQEIRDKTNKPNYEPALELYVYSIVPHRIICSVRNPDDMYEEVAHTVSLSRLLPEYHWKWGEMRGGSPALRYNSTHYLSFFHSSGRFSHKWIMSYYMGAYLFESRPPFAITHMSINPILAPNMINETLGWAYKVVDIVVFPMSFILDPDFIYVSYGHNDRDGWIAKLNRSEFELTLERVQSEVLGDSVWDSNDRAVLGTFRLFNGTSDTMPNHRLNHLGQRVTQM